MGPSGQRSAIARGRHDVHRSRASRSGLPSGAPSSWAWARADVAHYFIQPAQVEAEIERIRAGRNAVVEEIHRLQQTISTMGPKEAPHELSALLDVHLMLLQDEELITGVKHWITDRLYNAEWALTTQLEVLSRQFDDMEDEYLRERKADLEQVAERILRYMKGMGSPVAQPPVAGARPSRTCAGRQRRRAAGAGGARPVAGRHAAVQAERVRRLRDRRGRQDLAHRDRGAQPGHPGGGRRARRPATWCARTTG